MNVTLIWITIEMTLSPAVVAILIMERSISEVTMVITLTFYIRVWIMRFISWEKKRIIPMIMTLKVLPFQDYQQQKEVF